MKIFPSVALNPFRAPGSKIKTVKQGAKERPIELLGG